MKRLLQTVANSLGYEFRRIAARADDDPFVFAQRLIRVPVPVVFDVGAHHGETAKRLRSLFPAATIHCFEPFPESCRLLEQAADGDSLTQVHCLGLASRSGAATLTCNTSTATNSLLETDRLASSTWGDGLLDTNGRIEVTTTTLDAFCRGERIDRIDLLKIDTQGAEYAVLEGSLAMLSRKAIAVIVLEMITATTYEGQRSPADYFTLLESLGYKFSGVFSPIYRRGLLAQCDVAFTVRS